MAMGLHGSNILFVIPFVCADFVKLKLEDRCVPRLKAMT
jgi:hypothetical protein